MPPKKSVSDRAEEVKRRMLHSTMRHASDVRGAMGCYYCWIGDYARCDKHCKLVHRTVSEAMDRRVNPVTSPFDAATPYLTAIHAQDKSLFNEVVGAAQDQVTKVEQQLRRDEARRLFGDSFGATASGSLRKMTLYERRPSAALRHPELVSHKKPLEATIPHAARPGSSTIRVTPHTTLSVTPSRSSFTERHKDYLEDDTSIWGGSLAKANTTAHDDRSLEIGRRVAAMTRASIPAPSRKHLDRNASQFLQARAEPVLFGIAQGHYRSALELPVPSLYNEVL
jgi:hypothetical protein